MTGIVTRIGPATYRYMVFLRKELGECRYGFEPAKLRSAGMANVHVHFQP